MIRKEKGMKQMDLASSCGLSTNAVCNIEKGLSFPSKGTITKICEALGISEAYLLVSCITEDDLPDSKKILFRVLLEPFKKELSNNAK